LSDSSGGGVDPNSSITYVLGAAGKAAGEGGVAAIYSSDGEGMLFSHTFVDALLVLAGVVVMGEVVVVEALMSATV